MDGQGAGEIPQTYRSENLAAMRSAAFGRLTYRLRTELAVEGWHWNDQGVWSDPEHHQGYWTSDPHPMHPLLISYGYFLPRRGNTIDQAGNKGYSRLTDGDPRTFWKSNPYLDAAFTGEPATPLNAEWVLIDLGRPQPVDAIRIDWRDPYARRFEVQYWSGAAKSSIEDAHAGSFLAFPRGAIGDGHGGRETVRLADHPLTVRYLRLVLLESSGTAPPESKDLRDRLGFAIAELYVGRLSDHGRLRDLIRHARSNRKQTVVTTSSTDPWHRAVDRDRDLQQPGIDLVMSSGLARGQPILMPVGVLYDTPDNAVAEIQYLSGRGYPVYGLELGEEPDGQLVSPEHYAALYLEFAAAIRRSGSSVLLGGPSLQSDTLGWKTVGDAQGNNAWIARFIRHLTDRRRLNELGFWSFEWYPFEDLCAPQSQQLSDAPKLMRNAIDQLDAEGVPRSIPRILSEYGYSSYAGQAEVDMAGAVLNAEIPAQFLTLGGTTAYVYGLEPGLPVREPNRCDTWGKLAMFRPRAPGQSPWRLPTYYAAELLVREWAQPTEEAHTVYRTTVRTPAGEESADVTAYAVRRPDGQWGVLVLNKNTRTEVEVKVVLDRDGRQYTWRDARQVLWYSRKQYRWRAARHHGAPIRSEPPEQLQMPAGTTYVLLPPTSITVIRGTAATEGSSAPVN